MTSKLILPDMCSLTEFVQVRQRVHPWAAGVRRRLGQHGRGRGVQVSAASSGRAACPGCSGSAAAVLPGSLDMGASLEGDMAWTMWSAG